MTSSCVFDGRTEAIEKALGGKRGSEGCACTAGASTGLVCVGAMLGAASTGAATRAGGMEAGWREGAGVVAGWASVTPEGGEGGDVGETKKNLSQLSSE